MGSLIRNSNKEEKMKTKKFTTTQLTMLGLMAAVLMLMAYTPLGYLNIGPLAISFNVIPVAISAVVLGPVGGAVAGAIFGLTSFGQCIGIGGTSAMGAMLFSINPVLAFLQRFVPRLLDGICLGFIYKAIRKKTNMYVSCAVTGFFSAFLNTLFFMAALVGLFGNTEYVQGLMGGRNVIIGCCMMFAAGLSWKYILGAAAAAGAAVAVAFAFFSDKIGKGYQWYRILAVIDPENTTGWAPSEAVWKNIIYQQQRGEIAIGSGGIFGNGLFGGRYYSVPNAHNDFILCWIGNSAGFVGCCVVLGVLFALVVKTFATGARSEDLLGSYICAGIGGALMAQIAVNVGMNLRVLPVIGVTLPFYSAGGSSVLMLYICVGLVLSVYSHNTKSLFS